MFYDEVKKYKPLRGGTFEPSLLGHTANVPEGEIVGATPDGSLAGVPLADNASPHPGMDVSGPTATFKSVTKFDNSLFANGMVLNMTLHLSVFITLFGGIDELRVRRFASLLRTYLIDLKGRQVQFSIVSADVLGAAQRKPEKYKELMVKVAGYST